MAQLSSLLDRVHDEIPSVPEAMALRALSDAAKEFCSRTHAWQAAMPRIRTRENTTSYGLNPDPGVQVVALLDVRLDGTRLSPSPVGFDRMLNVLARPGTPTHFTQWGPAAVVLNCPPSETGTVTVTAALTVALGAVDVDMPDSLLDEYGEAIASGAKMRLVRMTAQPWSSAADAAAHAGPYFSAIHRAKSRAMTSLDMADMRIEMRKWV